VPLAVHSEKTKKSDLNIHISTIARKLCHGAVKDGVKNVMDKNSEREQTCGAENGRASPPRGAVEQLARDCITISIHDALKNITSNIDFALE
jgi:hypothetical protein